MRFPYALLVVLVAGSVSAEPLYIDEMVESPLTTLQRTFPELRREGCYRIGENRYLLIEIDRKDQKPWRVLLTATAPCRKPADVAGIEVKHRKGVEIGDRMTTVLEKLDRPDAATPPDNTLRRHGETEYFYICRVSEGCARHTSVFTRDGVVTAVGEWYSK